MIGSIDQRLLPVLILHRLGLGMKMQMGSDPVLDQPDQKVMGQDQARNMPMLRLAFEMLGIKFIPHIKVDNEKYLKALVPYII